MIDKKELLECEKCSTKINKSNFWKHKHGCYIWRKLKCHNG